MTRAKKYNIGALEAKDELQMERDEIVIEMIDQMQKYVAQAEQAAHNTSLDLEERLELVQHAVGCFCGLSNFLNRTMRIDICDPSIGMSYTQEMFNRMHYQELMLKVELGRAKNNAACSDEQAGGINPICDHNTGNNVCLLP